MPKLAKVLITALSVVVLALSLSGCFLLEPFIGSPEPSVPTQGLGVVGEAWGVIFQDYVEKDKLDGTNLSQGAIQGMMEALDDPYSAYLDPEAYQLSLGDLEGKFEGIGATVAAREAQIVIVAPIPGSPAAQAGIRPGDVIVEIDGQATGGMSVAEAVLLVRGPGGTTVRLLIRHEGETEPVLIEVVRAEIEVASVSYEMRGSTAHITISQFSGRTEAELIPVLTAIKSAGATGIVLDLRSNPGGSLPAVVSVASHFVTEGAIVSVLDNDGNRTDYPVEAKEETTDLAMVVLVDGYSASGSEVLAGALQDHGRATVAGKQTFGKGSVNVLRQLSDGSGIYITTGRWLTPNGRLIEGEGITPDIELDLEGDAAVFWAIDYLESLSPVPVAAAILLG